MGLGFAGFCQVLICQGWYNGSVSEGKRIWWMQCRVAYQLRVGNHQVDLEGLTQVGHLTDWDWSE